MLAMAVVAGVAEAEAAGVGLEGVGLTAAAAPRFGGV
jgi:hypothetical protein